MDVCGDVYVPIWMYVWRCLCAYMDVCVAIWMCMWREGVSAYSKTGRGHHLMSIGLCIE